VNGNQSPANDDGSDNAARPGGQGSPADHKGWYWHRYLPHFDQADVVQGITFRLADSLPSHVTDLMAEEWEEPSNREKRTRIEEYLNNGYGACHLKDERIGRLIEEALLHFDDQRYHLIAWVVMPNHVHVLVEQV
jgi:putative transposase